MEKISLEVWLLWLMASASMAVAILCTTQLVQSIIQVSKATQLITYL